MILADKVAVVADVVGVSDVLNLKTQQLSGAWIERVRPPTPLPATATKRGKSIFPLELPGWSLTGG